MRLAIALNDGRELLELQFFANTFRKLVIMLPVGILGPRVEAPVGKSNSLLVPDEDWAGVARPDTIGGLEVKLHALGFDVAPLQDLARCLLLARGCHDQVYVFMAGNVADDIGKDPWDGVKFSRPVRAVVRPRQPCGLMRLPFGGHTVSERVRGIDHRRGPDAARLNARRFLSLCRTCREGRASSQMAAMNNVSDTAQAK